VKIVDLSSSICNKTVSCQFEGRRLRNLAFKIVDMNLK